MAIGKKGVEAWWGFLAGAIVILAVIIFVLILYGQLKTGGEGATSSIIKDLGGLFR